MNQVTSKFSQRSSNDDVKHVCANATALLRAGQFAAAELFYRQVFTDDIRCAEAWYGVGLIALVRLDARAACAALREAVLFGEQVADYHLALGKAYRLDGEYELELTCYQNAHELAPSSTDILVSLGLAHKRRRQFDVAKQYFNRALQIDSRCVEALINRANLAYEEKQPDSAVRDYEAALELAPAQPELHNNLGRARSLLGEYPAAIAHLQCAVQLKPDYVQAWTNLAYAFMKSGQTVSSLEIYERLACDESASLMAKLNWATALVGLGHAQEAEKLCRSSLLNHPDEVDFHVALGTALSLQHRHDEAEVCHRTALALDSQSASAWCNLGNVLRNQGDTSGAISCYEQARLHGADAVNVGLNTAFAALLQQDFATGWPMYEYRYHATADDRVVIPDYPYPRWNGGSLAGKSLLLHREQGLGDEIMFASVIPELLGEAERSVITCNTKLRALFARSFPVATVIGVDPKSSRDAQQVLKLLEYSRPVDCQLPLGSLPLYRRRHRSEFPRHQGYLRADPRQMLIWRERLAELGRGFTVGISWRGGIEKTGTARRSIPLTRWRPLLQRRDVHFVSLQYTDCRDEIEQLQRETGLRVHHWQEAIDDYDATAALVTQLDSVISVCTALVHLSGALGQRTWVLAPRVPEWRYGLVGDDMPWYPSVKIFRQSVAGDWDSVFTRVVSELDHCVEARLACVLC